jgi:NAD(P)-dependent dehydrogenase (short-subunit alcohol dehydrogenase family)
LFCDPSGEATRGVFLFAVSTGALIEVASRAMRKGGDVDKQFEGKIAMVTGAGSGMGRATALELAARGATIVALDIRREGAEQTVDALMPSETPHQIAVVDVTSPDAVRAEVASVCDELGGIDLLCNAAGIADDGSRCHEVTDEQWHRVLAVDLYGPFHVCRAVLPSMVERGGGAIVNIASAAGLFAMGGGCAYTAAKHGLVGLTKRLAVEYGRQGVRVNAVCPGFIATEMNEALRDLPVVRQMVEGSPAGRWADPSEVAKLIVYLLSDDARYVMGAAVAIDGGWTVT